MTVNVENSISRFDQIYEEIQKSIEVINSLQKEEILQATVVLWNAIFNGHKVLACGNGGSAADAQHFVGELVNKLRSPREPFPAIALTANSSNLTSIANDTAYAAVFSRQIAALGEAGDVLAAFTTSGRSANIVQACQKAFEKQMKIILFVGRIGPDSLLFQFKPQCVIVDSTDTPRIQQAHEVAFHIICQLVDDELTRKGEKAND